MKRQITLWPDQMVATPTGDAVSVSAAALDAAMLEMSATLRTMGGHLLVAQDRVRVGTDEAITQKVVLQWRSHADANPNAETTIAAAEPQMVDAGAVEEIHALQRELNDEADAEMQRRALEDGEPENEPDDEVDSAIPTAVH